jgi:hypothetical protein
MGLIRTLDTVAAVGTKELRSHVMNNSIGVGGAVCDDGERIDMGLSPRGPEPAVWEETAG